MHKILGAIIGILLGSLIFWGLGNLIINVFAINYIWAFKHGFVAELIFLVLRSIFRNNK